MAEYPLVHQKKSSTMEFHKELTLIPEKPNLRVRSKSLNFLFGNISESDFILIYNKSVKFVRQHFKKDAITRVHASISEDVYLHFTREIALHWIYYYNVNKLKIKVTESDLEHPQTYQIAMRLSEKITGDAAESRTIAANLLGLRRADYEKWLRGYLQRVSMM